MEPAIANRSHGSEVKNINSTVYSVRQYSLCSERATLSMTLSLDLIRIFFVRRTINTFLRNNRNRTPARSESTGTN